MCLFSFQKPKWDEPVKKPKRDEPVKLSKEIEMLKETVERKELLTSTEVEGKTREERMIRKMLVKDIPDRIQAKYLDFLTVSLGYGSLPLTVTVSVETHLQSKSFLSSLLQAGIPFQVPCQSFSL